MNARLSLSTRTFVVGYIFWIVESDTNRITAHEWKFWNCVKMKLEDKRSSEARKSRNIIPFVVFEGMISGIVGTENKKAIWEWHIPGDILGQTPAKTEL